MGRKNRINKPQQPKTQHNLTNSQRELDELVDKLLRISTIPQQPNVLKSLENQREISNITEKVKSLEGHENSVDNRATNDIIGHFMKWVNENGAVLNGCSIHGFEGYELGIRAETDIEQSSLVIAVPRRLMMTIENAKESIMRELIEKDKILGSMPNVTLAIFLLVEKYKEKSFWKPYIDILPKRYTTVLYFNIEELEELKSSPTLEIALRQIKSITRQYAYFHKLFKASNDPVSKLLKDRFTYMEYW